MTDGADVSDVLDQLRTELGYWDGLFCESIGDPEVQQIPLVSAVSVVARHLRRLPGFKGSLTALAEERGVKFRRWYDEQKRFVLAKYGEHRVVSMVLHLDEQTPHIHVVILPLELRADGRSKDGTKRWALVGRTISGPGQFDRLQNEYARAMEPLGLSRGEVKSGRKHKPVREYLAELKAQEAANAARGADLEAGLARLRDQTLRAEVDRRAVQKEKQALAASRAASEQAQARIEAERGALEADRQLLEDLFGALETSRQKAVRFMEMVQRYPESRWTPEALLMARAATSMARGPEPDMEVLRAQAARMQSLGR